MNKSDVGTVYVEKVTIVEGGKVDMRRVSWGMFDKSIVKVDKNPIETKAKVYIVSKYSGLQAGEVETILTSTFYSMGDKEFHFSEQIIVDMDINPWDYGALVFKMPISGEEPDPEPDPVKDPGGKRKVPIRNVIGQVIGHVADGKNNKVIVTPFARVLDAMDKQIYFPY